MFFVQSVQLSGCLEENLNFFGLLPITEGKSLGSAVLIRVRDISKMLILESVVFWCRFSSIQSSLESVLTKANSIGLLPSTEGDSLGSAVLILVCDISKKLVLESVAFGFSFPPISPVMRLP